jgi:hypothetical protein
MRQLRLGVVVAGLALAAVVTAGSAAVAAGPGYGYDGTDPYATGCANNASVVASGSVVTFSGNTVGTAKLFYSWSCGTNWIWVKTSVGSPGGSPGEITTNVYRSSPYHEEPFTWHGVYPSGAVSWSNMIFAPSSCAYGVADIDSDFGEGTVWLYDPTC